VLLTILVSGCHNKNHVYYDLRLEVLSQERNIVSRLIQENLMEFLLQTSLPFILQTVVYVYITTNLL